MFVPQLSQRLAVYAALINKRIVGLFKIYNREKYLYLFQIQHTFQLVQSETLNWIANGVYFNLSTIIVRVSSLANAGFQPHHAGVVWFGKTKYDKSN